MRDRLSSLTRHIEENSEGSVPCPPVNFGREDETDPVEHCKLDEFLLKVLLQRKALLGVRQAADHVSQLYRLLLAALDSNDPNIDAVREMIKVLDHEFQEVHSRSASICSAINGLKDGMKEEGASGVDDRIRRDQLATLTESLSHVLVMCNRDYVEYEEASRQRALEYSTLHVLKYSAPEEERLLDFRDKEQSTVEEQTQLQRAISINECQALVQEVSERHEIIIRVGQSIQELDKLFHEMRIYIDAEANLTDRLEKNIEMTGEYVEKTLIETGITVQRKENIRKGQGCMGKSVYALRCVAALLFVLLVFLVISSVVRVGIKH